MAKPAESGPRSLKGDSIPASSAPRSLSSLRSLRKSPAIPHMPVTCPLILTSPLVVPATFHPSHLGEVKSTDKHICFLIGNLWREPAARSLTISLAFLAHFLALRSLP